MVKIRLARIGVKNMPCYRVVVTDVRNARDGKFLERLGFFNMVSTEHYDDNRNIFLDLTRIKYWLERGALLSNRVYFLIKHYKKRNGILLD